ncbi:MAG TPA: hypothetical protein VGG39_35455 [Polyangiaceae bacterium]|jgi:hypothetical protein
MIRRAAVALAVAAVPVVLACAPSAHADEHSVIRQYGDHPSYVFEAEPHGIIGFGYPYDAPNDNFGAGFRGTFHITNGFVKSIDDSIGVGVGLDFAPGGPGYFFIPVVMQWNFWVSTHWSVFGEPGVGFTNGPHLPIDPLIFYAGGRFHFSDRVALTIRLGYPDVSVGVSFFL